MNQCPKCGHQWPDQKRASGGRARWSGMTPEQRSAAARKAAKARWAKKGAKLDLLELSKQQLEAMREINKQLKRRKAK